MAPTPDVVLEVFMADFTLSKSLFGGSIEKPPLRPEILLRHICTVLLLGGAQLLNLLVHAPGIYEHPDAGTGYRSTAGRDWAGASGTILAGALPHGLPHFRRYRRVFYAGHRHQ